MAVRRSVRLDRARDRPSTAPSRSLASQPAGEPAADRSFGRGCGAMIAIVVTLLLIGRCASNVQPPTADPKLTALSEPAYVTARGLNCRREPLASAAVVERLSRDDQVAVIERQAEWARLDRIGDDCWVSNRFLSGEPSSSAGGRGEARSLMSSGTGARVDAGAGSVAARAATTGPHRHASRRRRTGRTRRPSGDFYGSGCPCSGAQVCIGPRGGRYCITSGGNKRYGV